MQQNQINWYRQQEPENISAEDDFQLLIFVAMEKEKGTHPSNEENVNQIIDYCKIPKTIPITTTTPEQTEFFSFSTFPYEVGLRIGFRFLSVWHEWN